ncbi:MAG: serine/threonine-protein kinase [Planctomycetota bacterium]
MPDTSPNSCAETSLKELGEFSEGILTDDRQQALLNHLPHCPACQQRLEWLIYKSNLSVKPAPRVGADEAHKLQTFRAHLQIPPEPEVHVEVGDRIGPFRLLKKLGKGGSSSVYDCMDEQLKRHVAVKVLNPRLFDDSSLARLEREARTLARLDHPWIVKAFDIKPYHFPPYIVMELVAGGPASRLIRKGPLPPRVAARLVAGVAGALHHAHEQGIVHRDIKPSNLLVVETFELEGPLPAEITLKVSDFGLARPMVDDSYLTSTNAILGTPAYMSPEQSRGKQGEVGPPSDIYALGVVLYEFLIGRPPLVAENTMQTLRMVNEVDPIPLRHIQPGLARDLNTICMKCLRKEPSERYTTAKELADDLQRFLEGRPIMARPIGPLSRLYRWCRRNVALAASLMGILTLLFAIVALAITFAFLENDLRQKVEASATLYKNAATEAGFESDAFRTLLFASVRNLSQIANELDKVQTHRDSAMVLSSKARNMNRESIENYLKRPYLKKELNGDRIDAYFRDAVALRDIGFTDESMIMLSRLLEFAYQAKPAEKDDLRLLSIGNRSAPVLGRIKLAQAKPDEAAEIMLKAFEAFRIPPNLPGLQSMHLIERHGLLSTLLKTLESQNPKPNTNQIRAEMESIENMLNQNTINR